VEFNGHTALATNSQKDWILFLPSIFVSESKVSFCIHHRKIKLGYCQRSIAAINSAVAVIAQLGLARCAAAPKSV
jgi:hypothetical protein